MDLRAKRLLSGIYPEYFSKIPGRIETRFIDCDEVQLFQGFDPASWLYPGL